MYYVQISLLTESQRKWMKERYDSWEWVSSKATRNHWTSYYIHWIVYLWNINTYILLLQISLYTHKFVCSPTPSNCFCPFSCSLLSFWIICRVLFSYGTSIAQFCLPVFALLNSALYLIWQVWEGHASVLETWWKYQIITEPDAKWIILKRLP